MMSHSAILTVLIPFFFPARLSLYFLPTEYILSFSASWEYVESLDPSQLYDSRFRLFSHVRNVYIHLYTLDGVIALYKTVVRLDKVSCTAFFAVGKKRRQKGGTGETERGGR
jgi:hypothetical protein